MDQFNGDRAPQGRAGGVGGSIRRARERAEAGLPPVVYPQPQSAPQRPYRDPTAGPNAPQVRARGPLPPALSASRGAGMGIGSAISRPTPVPQWPLSGAPANPVPERIKNQRTQPMAQPYQPPAGRGLAPPRPPRPSEVPQEFDSSQIDARAMAFEQRYRNAIEQGKRPDASPSQDEEYGAQQSITSPFSPASRPSTISSVGSIPDFPVPMPITPSGPRRSANLGPPPSSRRGASSYYSNVSYVSPIPEESPRMQPSRGSYASSAAIPSTWGSDSPGFNFYDGDEIGMSDYDDMIEEDRESSTNDDGEERGLVRSASIGRRGKPNMVTTRSSERIKEEPESRETSYYAEDMPVEPVAGAAAVNSAAAASRPAPRTLQPTQRDTRDTLWPPVGNANDLLAGGTGLIDPSTSSSETVPSVARAVTTDQSATVPSANLDARVNRILSAHEAATNIGGTTPPTDLDRSFSRLSAIRRPPRLNIDAVREAEARGSLTSLPDLIKRATKLAAMMEVGKRPGSRLDDLSGFPSDEDLARGEKSGSQDRHTSGLSNMLNAFPPPGLTTPTIREPSPRPPSIWPSGFGNASNSNLSQQPEKPTKPRRCCGLPVWGFLILLFGVMCIIAAAVVVPLELLVLHKSKPTTTTSVSDLSSCQASITCANGGTNTIASGVCSCICANGFTGETCTVDGNTGCTTLNINGTDGTLTNVTMGQDIPRLVQQADGNFSVPLSGDVILARFNAAGLSCESQNALVTFDGSAVRVGDASAVASSTSTPTTSILRANYATTATATTTGTPSTASSTSASFVVTQEVLDFARVAVLFVLQEEVVNNAITAQSGIQDFLNGNTLTTSAAANVSLGNTNSVNFVNFAVNLGQGDVGSGSSSSSRRTRKRWHAGMSRALF